MPETGLRGVREDASGPEKKGRLLKDGAADREEKQKTKWALTLVAFIEEVTPGPGECGGGLVYPLVHSGASACRLVWLTWGDGGLLTASRADGARAGDGDWWQRGPCRRSPRGNRKTSSLCTDRLLLKVQVYVAL